MRRSRRVLLLSLLLVGVGGGTALAIQVASYSPARHDRFYSGPDKNFIGDTFSTESNAWSGIGRPSAGSRWVTMISPSYFATSQHYSPGPGSLINFFPTNSPTTYITREVAWVQQVNGDLSIGKLTAPVPSSIKTYPLLDRRQTWDMEDRIVLVVGFRGSGYSIPGTNMTFGYGKFSQYSPQGYCYPGCAPPDYYETFNTGDSGAPTFVLLGGEVVLTGIHASDFDDSMFWFSFDQIAAVMSGESLDIRLPRVADFNFDNNVDFADFLTLSANYGSGVPPSSANPTTIDGDTNNDNRVDFADFLNLSANYDSGSPPAP